MWSQADSSAFTNFICIKLGEEIHCNKLVYVHFVLSRIDFAYIFETLKTKHYVLQHFKLLINCAKQFHDTFGPV